MALFGLGKKKKSTVPEGFEVPSFPAAVLNLLTKLRDPDVSIKELSQELEIDPGLHVRVLKTVNSAAFGLSHKVSNIQHAVNLLGRGRLESLVLSVAAQDGLSKSNKASWLDMKDFWAIAARRAAVARALAEELHPHLQGDVFTVALLEDIGIPILANRETERYRELYLAWTNDEIDDLLTEEKNSFGIDHASLGASVATDWEFPAPLIEAISSHHDNIEDVPLSLKVAALVKRVGNEDDTTLILKKAEQLYEIDSEETLQLIEQSLEKSQQLAAALN